MLRQRFTTLVNLLLSVWWVSWFGIIGGFLCVGVSEVRIEFVRGTASWLSLLLLVIVPLWWICFFVADSKVHERTPKAVKLLTIVGTSLAGFTLLGIWFFIALAGRGR